jgi:hypothetical protein
MGGILGGCGKCSKVSAGLFLLVGLLLLGKDFGQDFTFGIQWYTFVLVLIGVIGLAKSHCKVCSGKVASK